MSRRDPKTVVRTGAQLSAFIGGKAASLVVKGSAGASWSCSAQPAEDNREALRRVLVAALCWLDGCEQLVEPALSGALVMRPERRGS